MDTDTARKRLEEHRAELRATLEGLESDTQAQSDSTSELSTVDQHPGDIGTETFERAKTESIVESVRAALEDVEHAFRRIDQGTYGTCEVCGAEISDERLEAVPATRFCLQHQSEVERAPAS